MGQAASLVHGRYALHGELAAGGMATVHLATLVAQAGFSRTVAIKRLHPPYARDPEFVAAFLEEARVASRIRHPNVVATLDVVAEQGELFLVMEYVHGVSLSRLFKLSREGRVPVDVIVSIVCGVLNGLHAAHEATSEAGDPLHVVHRDVSPHNVMVGIDGAARVLDFGIAKIANGVQHTRDGQLKGKLAYMAPEQVMRKPIDARTDVYAAAAILWEGLTGRRLVEGDNDWQLAHQVTSRRADPPSTYSPDLPPELDALVLSALALNPGDRPGSALAFAMALESAATPASPRAVSAWLNATAATDLEQRAARVASIERLAVAARTTVADEVSGTSWPDAGAGSGPRAVPLPRSGSASDVLGTAAPQQPEGEQQHSRSRAIGFTVADEPGPTMARGRRVAAIVALFVTVAVVSLLAFYAGSRRIAPPFAPAGAVVPSAVTAVIEPVLTAAARVDPTAATGVASAPATPPRAPASASPPPSPRALPRRVAPTAPRAPNVGRPPAPAPEPGASTRCSPPYYIDDRGVKQIKSECL